MSAEYRAAMAQVRATWLADWLQLEAQRTALHLLYWGPNDRGLSELEREAIWTGLKAIVRELNQIEERLADVGGLLLLVPPATRSAAARAGR